jgi:hypothetical protein
MFKKIQWYALFLFLIAGNVSKAQQIVYSEPEKDDSRRMDFEIIGKFGPNFLIYKSNRNRNTIAVFDNGMKQVGKVDLDYLPQDKLINVDFFPYSDFSYMIFEYQKRNVVYCMGVKIDGNGKKISDIQQLDSSHIGMASTNKVYTAITSEDKSKILLFKINSKNRQNYALTTVLFNNRLDLLKRNLIYMPFDDRNEYVDDFNVDNDGNLVFAKFLRQGSDNITRAALVVKLIDADSLESHELNLNNFMLDEIHIKIDNYNKRYLLASFYYKQRRGNIEGLYFYLWDRGTSQPVMETTALFNDDLRKEAKGESNIKSAFNDYFIRNLVLKKDGGFIIGSESYYTTSRYGGWNRWDYLYGSPFMSPYDYYYYAPYYSPYGLWRPGFYGNNYQSLRYHADNIVILSFDKNGKPDWSNVIRKEQFDDDGDMRVSYQIMNTGGQLHILFNMQEKRTLLLNDYTVTGDGQINRNPTLKNLDRGYEFMAKYGKQVSAKQMIIPCIFRNYICFAKVEFN